MRPPSLHTIVQGNLLQDVSQVLYLRHYSVFTLYKTPHSHDFGPIDFL